MHVERHGFAVLDRLVSDQWHRKRRHYAGNCREYVRCPLGRRLNRDADVYRQPGGRTVQLHHRPDGVYRRGGERWLDDILELWERDHPTILYVTHNFQEAIRLADRVCVLSRRPGRVREIIDIPIPRSQRTQPQHQTKLSELGNKLWSLIKEEAIVADRAYLERSGADALVLKARGDSQARVDELLPVGVPASGQADGAVRTTRAGARRARTARRGRTA